MQTKFRCGLCRHETILRERWDSAAGEPDCEQCGTPMEAVERTYTVAEEQEMRHMMEAYEAAEAKPCPHPPEPPEAL
jgi:hypothetical protein